MSFESKFQSGAEKPEENLTIEQIRKKINEKTDNSEAAKFFNEKDKENLQVLKSHPESSLNTLFKYSRTLMHEIKKNPQIIDKRIKFFKEAA